MINYLIKEVNNEDNAEKVIEFLQSKNAFEGTLLEIENEIIRDSVLRSLNVYNHVYYFAQYNDEVVGAIGVRENKYITLGFEASEEYFAVHKDYRRKGIGQSIFNKIEEFVKERKGRYLVIETCDTDFYANARNFYEKNGFKNVGSIPFYYTKDEGKIFYYKKFN